MRQSGQGTLDLEQIYILALIQLVDMMFMGLSVAFWRRRDAKTGWNGELW